MYLHLLRLEVVTMGQGQSKSDQSIPGKHNSLFGPGDSWWLNACVGKNGGYAEFDRLARGYFCAGEVLVERVVEDRSSLDVLIYPLVQNYRQGIENMLKYLVQLFSRLEGSTEKVRFTHSLTDNWQVVRKHLKKLGFEKNKLNDAQHVIEEFVDIDATGATFRYPKNLKEERHLEETMFINVGIFLEGMEILIALFEEADCYASGMLAQQHEMEDYYGAM